MDSTALKESFVSAVHRFGRINLGGCFDSGLTRGEFFCLGVVRSHCCTCPEEDGMNVRELARRMRVQPPAVSRLLGALERRGLVQRTICPEDRRNISVSITDNGAALWQDTARRLDLFTDRVVERMGPQELTALVALLDRLCTVMEEEKEVLRQCSN